MHKIIKTEDYNIEFCSLISSSFERNLIENYKNSKIVILLDENTEKHCLDYLITNFSILNNAEIIVLPSGEENKTLEFCAQVWEALTDYKIGRKDLIVNVGGGVITDMGGFIASIYKRGIDFINIPTTLLAMVDASIGGKTGVDLLGFKNQLGVFSNPKAIYIDTLFLESLTLLEKQNGLAEMLKHALIASEEHWNLLKNIKVKELKVADIWKSVEIKKNIVSGDPFEKGERKKLNFGHTFGHAFESYLLNSENKITHGHAVALGMICESYLSFSRNFITQDELNEIVITITSHFKIFHFEESVFKNIFELMEQDKKNEQNKILTVLISKIGSSIYNQEIEYEDFSLTMRFLNQLPK